MSDTRNEFENVITRVLEAVRPNGITNHEYPTVARMLSDTIALQAHRPPTTEQPVWLNVHDAAKALGKSPAWVYKRAKAGKMEWRREGPASRTNGALFAVRKG